MAETLKERLSGDLAGGGAISSGDVASFAHSQEAVKTPEQKRVESGPSEVPQEAINDPVMKAANTQPAAEETNKQHQVAAAAPADEMSEEMARAAADMGIDMPETIEITEVEKEAFLETIISGGRFQLPFSIFGGRVTGVLQSRLNLETRAMLSEIHRAWAAKELESMIDYTARFRYACFRFQVAEIYDTQLETPKKPLKAVLSTKDGEPITTPPAWSEEAEVMFGNYPDGVITALYKELVIFEKKYWTMVSNSADQNFWNPVDSSSA